MPKNVALNNSRSSLMSADYARHDRLMPGKLQVRGTQFGSQGEWPYHNSFEPEEFRRLARYMLALADEAELMNPLAKLLAQDLALAVNKPDEDFTVAALQLIQKGYRK